MEATAAMHEIFSCPSCRNLMAPPIFMCDLGHSFCENCYYNVDKCPTCRATISARRNVAIERIQSNFVFSCCNQDDGCNVNGPAAYIREHEEFCEHSLTQCELKIDDCRWTGVRGNVMKHCLERHPDNVVTQFKQTLVWIKSHAPSTCRIQMSAFGKQFLGIWYCEDVNSVDFSISYLGPAAEASKYFYSIEMGTGDGARYTKLYKRKCHSSKACRTPRRDIHVITKLENVIKNYDERNEFYYTVTIYDHYRSHAQMLEDRRNDTVDLRNVIRPKWRPSQINDIEAYMLTINNI